MNNLWLIRDNSCSRERNLGKLLYLCTRKRARTGCTSAIGTVPLHSACTVLAASNPKRKDIMTKNEAMARFMAAKEKKRQCVERLEERMKKTYEQRTGKPANYTFVL